MSITAIWPDTIKHEQQAAEGLYTTFPSKIASNHSLLKCEAGRIVFVNLQTQQRPTLPECTNRGAPGFPHFGERVGPGAWGRVIP